MLKNLWQDKVWVFTVLSYSVFTFIVAYFDLPAEFYWVGLIIYAIARLTPSIITSVKLRKKCHPKEE
jgi:hypothetical protein